MTRRLLFNLSLVPVIGAMACHTHGSVLDAGPQVAGCGEPESGSGSPAAIRWFGPGQADEARRHARWCRAVGMPVLAAPAPDSQWDRPSAASRDSILVVSYNAALGSGRLDLLVDRIRSGALTGGPPVGDFVILVQETVRMGSTVPEVLPAAAAGGRAMFPEPDSGDRLDVIRLAGARGLHVFYVPAMRSGRALNPAGLPEDRGNAILSTRPLEALSAVELPFGGARRVANGAVLRGRGWQLGLVNLHLDVGPFGPSALSAIRARQARAVAQAYDLAAPWGRALPPAVVVGGDLNSFSLTGTAESVRVLREAFPDGHGPGRPTRGWQRLDHLFFRAGGGLGLGRVGMGPDTFGSDHHPIFAWVGPADPTGSFNSQADNDLR
ncbi:MAG: endonuclease/exonuclease/phosphatase family protein [Gemmatimonadales bacterium]